MNERETAQSQLALAETSYAKAKQLGDHDSAFHCAELVKTTRLELEAARRRNLG